MSIYLQFWLLCFFPFISAWDIGSIKKGINTIEGLKPKKEGRVKYNNAQGYYLSTPKAFSGNGVQAHQCEAGYYCPGNNRRHICPIGTFSKPESGICGPCPGKNAYTASEGTTFDMMVGSACKNCLIPGNSVTKNPKSKLFECAPCPKGTYEENGKCLACKGQTNKPDADGATLCNPCLEGQQRLDGVCKDCALGTYRMMNMKTCEPCFVVTNKETAATTCNIGGPNEAYNLEKKMFEPCTSGTIKTITSTSIACARTCNKGETRDPKNPANCVPCSTGCAECKTPIHCTSCISKDDMVLLGTSPDVWDQNAPITCVKISEYSKCQRIKNNECAACVAGAKLQKNILTGKHKCVTPTLLNSFL